MDKFFVFLIIGVATSAVYAISATGLVVTYVTSGVFNFAHGAIGMFLAFVYWELRVNRGWPTPLALVMTLLVIAPTIGVLLDAAVMRPLLKGASVATRLVVTLALLLSFQGLALAIWGIELRTLPGLWGNRSYSILGLNVSWDQTTTILAAVAVAFGFRALFRYTRLGVAMRAVVDNRELCAVKGLNPNVVTAASWAIGCSLAGLAAILIAPGLNLEANTLSILVVSAYAAAVLGRLQNLPATFVGALILGVSQAMVVAYLPSDNQFVRNLRPAIPFLLLFIALLARRELRLPERIRTHSEPEPPAALATWGMGAAAVLVAIPLSGALSPYQLLTGSKGFVFAAITISLVLLTGLSGQVSLMQMSFAGLGAVVLAKLPDGIPFVFSLGIAALAVGIVGGLVALPALRLRGLYLALLTLALAILMDNLVFGNSDVLGGGTTLAVERPSLFGWHFESERALFVVLVVVAVVFANIFLAVRRSAFGRMLAAMRDAPNACQTLGMNITITKLKVFGLSALMAGTAGAFLGGLQSRIGQLDFLWFRSLSVLLVATVFGITSMSGAFLGAAFFVVLPDLISRLTSGDSDATATLALQPLIIGVLAIATARRPEGLAGQLRNRVRPIVQRLPRRVWAAEDELLDIDVTAAVTREVSVVR